MISFYPGPSKIYPEVKDFMTQACDEGILSVNHRSKEFVAMSESTINTLKTKLNIPGNYWVFFTSSATECWEIIAQSLVKKSALHIYNGAFGGKWFEYSKKIKSETVGVSFGAEEELVPEQVEVPVESEIICLTQNETSNGTQVKDSVIKGIRELHSEKLIAIDATSSMGGIAMDFSAADVWFASVQKCFGLPAGLGIMICSPAAIQRAQDIGEDGHYNSLLFLKEKMESWQTSITPNVLGIYLLGKVMKMVPDIFHMEVYLKNRRRKFEEFLSTKSFPFTPLINNLSVKSDTVICLEGPQEEVARIKEKASESGILLGNGYGKWKGNTFRVANFPALSDNDFDKLIAFLKEYK